MDYKDRIKKAIDKYSERELKKLTPKASRKNNSPEKDFVSELVVHMRRLGFNIDVVESKAVYSVSAGRYLKGNLPSGFSDIVGNNSRGLAVYVEAKAPGRRSTLRDEQREFLISKIKSGCFAIVCDSIEDFDRQLKAFEDTFYLFGQDQRASLLLENLPK